MHKFAARVTAGLLAFAPIAAADAQNIAQTAPATAGTVFDGDYLTIGAGAVLTPSYDGSDDYVLFPIPVVQGRYKGVEINPRAGGVALDFIPDNATGPNFALGVSARVRTSRSVNVADDVVELLPDLDTAFEVGPYAGVSMPGVLNPYDTLSFTTDVRFDVSGAHEGVAADPSVTYFTPLSRAMAAALSLSASWGDDSYSRYYYTVTPAQSLATGGRLPVYYADSGFYKAGANLVLGYDLDGDLTNGGFALAGIFGYQRMLGDGKDSPFTSVRGSRDQFTVGGGVGYTF